MNHENLKIANETLREYRSFLYTYRELIESVTDGIRGSQSHIQIMMSSTGFGDVTENPSFRKFQGALIDKACQGLEVELIFLNDRALGEVLYQSQFPGRPEEFYDDLLAKANSYAKQFVEAGVKIYRADYVPFFLAIFDRKRVVVSHGTYKEGKVELVAFTSGHKSAIDLFDVALSSSKEYAKGGIKQAPAFGA